MEFAADFDPRSTRKPHRCVLKIFVISIFMKVFVISIFMKVFVISIFMKVDVTSCTLSCSMAKVY